MPVATRAGGPAIHYERHGDPSRPAVMLVQGTGLSGRYWFALPGELVAAGYSVVVPDNRGTGRSGRPRGPYRTGEMADDLAAVLVHAGVERAVVVGVSLGGMVAQELALRHAARVSALVLLSTTAGLPHGTLPQPRALATLLTVPFLPAGKVSDELNRLMLGAVNAHRGTELFQGWDEAMATDPVATSTFLAHLGAAALHSAGFRLPTLAVPTAIVAGSDDTLVPPTNARTLARLIPHAHLHIVDGAGHAVTAVDRAAIPRALGLVLGRRDHHAGDV